MATPPVYLDLRQLVSNLIDWTDPENPVLRTSGSGGGGGGGGDVAVTSIAPGTNNIGKVDIEAALPEGTNTLGHVFVDGTVQLAAGSNLVGRVASPAVATSVDVAPVTVSNSAGGSDLIGEDSARWTLTFYNYGANDMWVNHSGATPLANRGWFIKAGAERTFVGGLAARAWKGLAITSSTTVALAGGVG